MGGGAWYEVKAKGVGVGWWCWCWCYIGVSGVGGYEVFIVTSTPCIFCYERRFEILPQPSPVSLKLKLCIK